MSDLKKLFRKEHPFITEPDTWIVAGHSMSGDPLDRVPVQGRIQITHEEGKIVNLGEMDEIAATFRSAGLPAGFHEAAGEIYRRMEGLEKSEAVPALEEVLAALLKD